MSGHGTGARPPVVDPPPALFVHIQKTAGTALMRRFRHAFGPDAVYPQPSEQGRPEVVLDVDRLLARLVEERGAIRVVTGHFPLATADRIGGDVPTFTVLRDPVERVLSFLRHQREVEPRFAGCELDEIYADPALAAPLLRDHMVRMLSLDASEMTAGALTPIDVDARRVERALDALAHRVDVVGFQHDFESFCDRLADRFGWDLGPPLFMNRTGEAPASDALRERIARDNRHDVELYARAAAAAGAG